MSDKDWEAYHTKIDKMLKDYNRILTKSNARHCYVNLVGEGLKEEIAYEANKLTEELHFSACEMYFYHLGKKILTGVTLEDFKELRNILPKGYEHLPYYSKPTSKMLYDVIEFCEKKKEAFNFRDDATFAKDSKYSFYDHISRYCNKELHCYRGYGHKELDFLD